MVPVFQTDLTDRENPTVEWKHYELWEKIEQRRRRAKHLWIAATLFVSLCLLSVPTIMENRPKWGARVLARQLALRLVRMKSEASIRRVPQQLSFSPDGSLAYRVDVVERCGQAQLPVPTEFTEKLVGSGREEFRLLRPEQGDQMGIPGLVSGFCYNPVEGAPGLSEEEAALGLGFISVKDLADSRSDRVSVVLLHGRSAEISFN